MNAELANLGEQAREALRGRDPVRALAILARAEQQEISVPLLLDKALALRMLGRSQDSLATLEAALILDPSDFLALLSKGALLEHLGRGKEAAHAYKASIAVAPAGVDFPPAIATALARARSFVAAAAEELAERLRASVAELRSGFSGDDLERFDESLDIYAGVKRAFVQEPLLLHYPRLPAIPFHDRGHFPWLAELETATDVIAEELNALRNVALEEFAPYIAFRPGAPVNQWAELNHSLKWSSFFLWRNGARQEQACALCPRTAALLDSLPMADQTGYAPSAMFSVLDARTRIPPHTGSSNTRLVVHLPLVLPGPARFRVGNVTRDWRMGEAWVFDDTIEHEAFNDAPSPRTILIFDVWNPFLSPAERALISAMMTARKAYELD